MELPSGRTPWPGEVAMIPLAPPWVRPSSAVEKDRAAVPTEVRPLL